MANQNQHLAKVERELKNAQLELEALRKIKSNFNLLVNNIDEFVWLMNGEYHFTYVSPSVYKTIGYKETEFLKTDATDILGTAWQETIDQSIYNSIENQTSNNSKKWITQVKHKNGTLIWIESTTKPLLNENGNFNGIIGVSRDVTNQEALKHKMLENEANLQAQIDNTHDSIWSIDDAFCIKTLNQTFKTSFKLAFGIELSPGISILNSLPEPFRSQWKERYSRALNGEHFTVTDYFEFNETPQYVEVNFNPIKFNQKVIGVSVFSRDITKQTLYQKELTESTANLSSTIEHTDARIWSIDTNFNILTINKNFYNDYLIAFNVKLKKGSYVLENVPEPMFTTWKQRYQQALNGENVHINDELDIEGVPQFIEVLLSPIKINDEIIGATCFSRDVTKQRISEISLLESEAKYKSLVDNLPSVSYRCLKDKHWTMKFISNEIEALTGYKTSDFIDNKIRSYASIILNEDREYVDLIVTEKLESKENFNLEYRIVDSENKIKWVHEQGRGQYKSNGELEYIDGVISDITIRKKSEIELQKSEQRFRVISDASIDMLSFRKTEEILAYTADILSKQLYNTLIVSQVFTPTNSLKPNTTSGIKLAKYTSQSSLNNISINKSLKKQLKEGKLFETRLFPNFHENFAKSLIKDKTNKLHFYSLGIAKENELYGALHFVSENNDTPDSQDIIESVANITSIFIHRQQLIESIQHSEEKFRSLFENTTSVIAILTIDEILMVNNAFCKLLNYTTNELISLKPIDLVHPNQKHQVMQQLEKRFMGELLPTNTLIQLLDKRFTEKWIDISTTIINYEGTKAVLIVGSDITERRKADIELNKFSTGIMNSPSSIVITDIDGTIEYVNPYFTEATGYTLEEAIGKNPKILSSGNNPKEIYVDMWNTILKGEVWNGELQNQTKQGQIYWEAVRIAPIFDEGGIITNFIAIKEDITERKRTLELIEQSEKDLRQINAKKDKFFSIIAHDLRSPFSGLAGLVGILKSSYNELTNQEIDRYLDLINQSTQNISKLLENLLSWAKSQTGKVQFEPKQLNLLELVNSCIDISNVSANQKEINIQAEIDTSKNITADENMINTVLRNLLSNAIKYTHRNGQIIITSTEKIYHNRKFEVIGVRDNGVGIPPEKQHKIFKIEENFTTKGTEKENGTGLGLILCKEFVERHGGHIWCESQENEGTTFYFSLPVK